MNEQIAKLEADLLSSEESTRWQAAAELSEFVENEPEILWPLVVKHGSSDDYELRAMIATCVLEHVLEHHFKAYFPRLKAEIERGNRNLRDTLSLCWKMGEAEVAENSARWDDLLDSSK